MFRLLYLFLIIVVCIGLGPLLVGHQGRVIIETENMEIVTSITVLCMLILALIVSILFLQWFIKRIYRATAATTGWFIGRSHVRAIKQTRAGLLRLIEGDDARAEKLFSLSASNSDQPVINFLLAAEAAQRRNDILATNKYLEQADLAAGEYRLPVDITRIRIQLAHGANEAARHSVEQLLADNPYQPELLRLAHQAYMKTEAYKELLELLPAMRKVSLYDDATLQAISLDSYQGLMKKIVTSQGNDALKQWLSSLSRSERNNIDVNVMAIQLLIEQGDTGTAEQMIIDGLKREYNEKLVQLIRQLPSGNTDTLEKYLKKIITKQGDTPLLNSAIGTLLIRREQWQEASDYLQKSVAHCNELHDYALLAIAYDHLDMPDLAAQVRKKGLELVV